MNAEAMGFGDVPAPPTLPEVDHEPVVRELWGETVVDELAWLRESDDPAVLALLEEENAHVDAVLSSHADLPDTIFGEFKNRIKETDLSVPVEKDGWSYYARTEEGLEYTIHCRKPVPVGTVGPVADVSENAAQEHILLDENVESAPHDFFELGVFELSPDHQLLLWGSDTTGEERFRAVVRDLSSGKELSDELFDLSYGSAWALDNRTFFYIRPDDANRPYQVWRHELGTSQADDVLVFEESDEAYFVGVGRERDDSYIQISVGSAVTDETWLIPADVPDAAPRCLQPRRHGIEYAASHQGDRFIIHTNENAENFKLVEAPEATPGSEHWVDLIPHRPDVNLAGFDALRDHLVLFERVDATMRMRVRAWETGDEHIVEQAEPVSSVWAGANPTADTSVYRYGYSSMVSPAAVMLYDLETRERTVLKETEVLGGFDASDYETKREWAVADDGTRVPMSLVWKKDRPAGPGPAVIGAYGAYEISSDPTFSAARLSLLDRGFVVAIAHVRGGGEMGRPWYLDGKFEHKPNTFSDTVACARHLIDEGWTTPAQLGVRGGSAGGLLVGATINLAPELFGAAVAQVAFVDSLNTILDPSLPLTVTEWEEWGNPAESEEIYRVMRSYTPYENVQAAPYPAIYASGGLNDSRVGYWEPAKWVHRLREVTTGNKPIVLHTDLGAGHGGPSGRYESWRDEARVLTFLLIALGAA